MSYDERTEQILKTGAFTGVLPDEVVVRDAESGAVIDKIGDIEKAAQAVGTQLNVPDRAQRGGNGPPMTDGGRVDLTNLSRTERFDLVDQIAEAIAQEGVEEWMETVALEGLFQRSAGLNQIAPIEQFAKGIAAEQIGNPEHSQHLFTIANGVATTFTLTTPDEAVFTMPHFSFGNMDIGDLNWEMTLDNVFEWDQILLTQDIVEKGVPPSGFASPSHWGFTVRDTIEFTVTNTSGAQRTYEDTLSLYQMDEEVFEEIEDIVIDLLKDRWDLSPDVLERSRINRR